MNIYLPFTADKDDIDVKEHPHRPVFLLQNNKFAHCASFRQNQPRSFAQYPIEGPLIEQTYP